MYYYCFWLHWVFVAALRVSLQLWLTELRCPGACGILVPQPGIKPTSSALEGGFLTTGPPGKSPDQYFNLANVSWFCCSKPKRASPALLCKAKIFSLLCLLLYISEKKRFFFKGQIKQSLSLSLLGMKPSFPFSVPLAGHHLPLRSSPRLQPSATPASLQLSLGPAFPC